MGIRLLAAVAYLALSIHVPKNLGYAALAALIAGETMGVPLPGESALIVAGILASDGHLSIELVIVVAAGGGVVGGNVGVLLGRPRGRRVRELPRPPPPPSERPL